MNILETGATWSEIQELHIQENKNTMDGEMVFSFV